jgi:hypothetical protein
MSYESDILAPAVASLRSELIDGRRERFDQWAVGKTLKEQMHSLTSALMESWQEPEVLAPAPVKAQRSVRAPDRSHPEEARHD